MSDELPKADSVGTMLKQLVLVLLGLAALVLFLAVAGGIADRYYTAREAEKLAELDKQEAFTQGLTYEEYLRRREAQQAALAAAEGRAAAPEAAASQAPPSPTAAGTGAQAASPTEVPAVAEAPVSAGQMILPPPDLDVTDADMAAMTGKAAVVHTTLGSFVIELNPQAAPRSVKNFKYLVEKGFYEGLPIFRTVPGVLAEMGSPNGRRGGTPGYWVDPERSRLYPSVGTVAFVQSLFADKMASEIVIFLRDGEAFVEEVHVFGRVIDRLNVVEKCADSRCDRDGYLLDQAYITKVEMADMSAAVPKPASPGAGAR
jgi:cyclophilin family peptidyl-prolyl cis-trans isomerase